MATTAPQKTKGCRRDLALAGVPHRPLAERDQRPRLHPAELHAVRRRRRLSRPGDGAHAGASGTQLTDLVRRGAPQGRARCLADSELHHRPRARLHRPRERDHRRAADRCAAQAGDHAERRLPDGCHRAEDLRLRARSARRRGVHQVPQDPQRRRLRRLYGRRPALPKLAHPDRPARRLRSRPDHRRLPPCRALRRGAPRRAQAAGEGQPRCAALDRRDHPRSRGAVRTDPGAQRAPEDGGELRLRHLASGARPRKKRCSGSISATWRE